MNPGKDFNQNINQLIDLLKKIVSHIPSQNMPGASFANQDQQHSVQFNLCFFNLLPIPAEDFEDLEELYEQHLAQHEDKDGPVEDQLTPLDFEFLKRNGIRF